MPNTPISSITFAIILLASIDIYVSSFIVIIPEQELIEVQRRAINFGIQYGAIAIGQAVVGATFVDPASPKQLFVKGL